MKSLEKIKQYASNLELLTDKHPNIVDVLEELQQAGAIARTSAATDYTATETDSYIGITSTAAARTVTLPSAAVVGDGKTYIVKDESGAAATHNITVDPDGSETIDGAGTKVISANYGTVRIISNGTNWFTY